MNRVKIYSNGTVVISREYELSDEPLDISVPVRKTDLCDAVGTLTVIGDVDCPEPPSYEPVGANETALSLDSTNFDKDLATKLAGAKIKLSTSDGDISGVLAGIQEYTEWRNEIAIERYRVSVKLDNGGHKSFHSTEIIEMYFVEEKVRSEVDKALQRAFSEIKPDSSFIQLKVVPKNGAKSCTVVYAVPAAAWKIRYHLNTQGDEWSLDQQAIVDNDTDDDWRESVISVVTGEPITFATDLAEIRRPGRSKVNVVANTALGAVDMEVAIPEMVFPCVDVPSQVRVAKSVVSTASLGTPDDDDSSLQQMAAGTAMLDSESYAGRRVQHEAAEYRESGDFAIFESPTPVTILSDRSAIIPIPFKNPNLGDGKSVLVYKESKDNRRPFRALRFKNTTGQSFGKGVCEIIMDGELQGKAVLQGAKPDEEVSLVYAKETGVKIFKELKSSEQQVIGLKIAKSVAIWTRRAESETLYKIDNVKDEEFILEIEHIKRSVKGTIQASCFDGEQESEVPFVQIENGIRASVTIPSKSQIVVKLEEKGETEQQLGFGGPDRLPQWLSMNVINVDNPIDALAANEQILKLIDVYERIENKRLEMTDVQDRVNEIDQDQSRLSGLIDKMAEGAANKYQSKIAENEEEREKLVKEIKPKLLEEFRSLESERDEMAMDFTLNWTAE